MKEDIIVEIVSKGVARVTLNRPEKHNAINGHMIALLTDKMNVLSEDDKVRVVILSGGGESFCAGADLQWMKRTLALGRKENIQDAKTLANLLFVLDRFPKPLVGVIQGPAYGGGVGLVAVCDIAIASENAFFSMTEVRLGLIPAVISPFVVRAIGTRHARRFILTGERFSAQEAMRIGLIHEVVKPSSLEDRCSLFVSMLQKGGPGALTQAKNLISEIDVAPINHDLMSDLAERIADLRVSNEGQEGMNAFFEKRKPLWS